MKHAVLLATALSTQVWALDLTATVERDIGITPGDMVSSTVTLPAPVDRATIPSSGRVTTWLDLKQVDVQAEGTRLHFVWQVLGTVEATAVVNLPRIELRSADGEVYSVVPATFHLSSVLPAVLPDRHPRPAPKPARFDTRTPLSVAAACATVALSAALALLWLADRLPGWPRRPGPLLALWRSLRARRALESTELDDQTLQSVNASLAKIAGRTLYPHMLPVLFDARPSLAPHREEIERFFDLAWSRLFGEGSVVPSSSLDWLEPAVWSERLARQR